MCTTEWFLIELDLSSRSYYAPPTASFQCLPHLGTEAHCRGSVKPQQRGCDFKKAFDSIVRTKMLRILPAYGIPHQMVEAIKVMDKNTSALVINRQVPHRHWSASRWSTGSVPIHNLSRLCPDNCHLTIWWNYIEKVQDTQRSFFLISRMRMTLLSWRMSSRKLKICFTEMRRHHNLSAGSFWMQGKLSSCV